MPTNSEKKITTELIVPLKELLVQIAKSVADAQQTLDQQALQLQKELYVNEDLKDLRDAGAESTWYQIPEVNASLKISLSMHSESQAQNPNPEIHPLKLRVAPYNATYQNSYDYDFKGTSELAFKIVPIPPPYAATLALVPNLKGKTKDGAIKLLAEARLRLGNVYEKESTKQKDIVLEQNPEYEAQIRIGEPVDIIVSKSE